MKKIIALAGFMSIFMSQAIFSSAGYFNADPIIRCESQTTSSLFIGSENDDVYALQVMLANRGYLQAAPNGYFGYQTARAVRMFQRDNGLMSTGYVGSATLDAINSSLCNSSYQDYGYSTGSTYAGGNDPFVKVISPAVTAPAIYATPQNLSSSHVSSQTNTVNNYLGNLPISSQIASTNIIYNPSIGYTYGITPQSGTMTIASPGTGSFYQEGDTVSLSWSTNNIQPSAYSVVIESSITGQSKTVAVTSGTSYSFVLTKELLDAVCSGACSTNQYGTFKIGVTTQIYDIAGIQSTLRAMASSITIKRPFGITQVSVTASKMPVNSGEMFKLYINVPSDSTWDTTMNGSYSMRIRAVCPSSVSITVAGVSCGTDFVAPFTSVFTQKEIPVTIVNPTWYKQDVTFQVSIVNVFGQVISSSETRVTANSNPMNW